MAERKRPPAQVGNWPEAWKGVANTPTGVSDRSERSSWTEDVDEKADPEYIPWASHFHCFGWKDFIARRFCHLDTVRYVVVFAPREREIGRERDRERERERARAFISERIVVICPLSVECHATGFGG